MYTIHSLLKFELHKCFCLTVDKKNPTPSRKQHPSYGTFTEAGKDAFFLLCSEMLFPDTLITTNCVLYVYAFLFQFDCQCTYCEIAIYGMEILPILETEPLFAPDEQLTDGMLVSLAKKVTSQITVHNLAVRGLGIERSVVESSIYNHNRDINMAMFDVLRQWRLSQPSAREAYSNLYQALVNVQMSELTVVLK